MATKRTKIEITSYDAVVFEGEFESLESAERFWAWWARQAVMNHALPIGGAVIWRADIENKWRAAHPLSFQPLTAEQLDLVERYMVADSL